MACSLRSNGRERLARPARSAIVARSRLVH